MAYKEEYTPGAWAAICDICGWKFKSHELKKRWDGKMVCDEDFEARHPSDFIRHRNRELTVPYIAPESTDTFISVTYAASNVGVQENTKPTGTFDNSI